MMIPYRTRRAVSRLCTTLLILLLIATVAVLFWFLWLNRYVVYTREGVRFDFGVSLDYTGGEIAKEPAQGEKVPLIFSDDTDLLNPEDTELAQISGVYITAEMLKGDIPALSAYIQTLPTDTAVMIDVKNIQGKFFYNSSLGRLYDKISQTDLEEMIATLDKKGYYLIARFPAFRDYWHGYDNVPHGIHNKNRQSLWFDLSCRCYWLDPTKEGTITYVAQIISELKLLGFDEAAMYDFKVPDTNEIYFEGDREEAIVEAAEILVTSCSNDRFAVSFISEDPAFSLPVGRSRLYLENVAAADLASVVQQTQTSDSSIYLVFLTELMDTRFDDYGALRPLSM